MGHQQKEQGKDKKYLLLLLLLLLLGFSAHFLLENPKAAKLNPTTVNRINRYLQDVAKIHELRAMQVNVENSQAEKLDNSEAQLASIIDRDRQYGVDLVQDRHQETVYEETKGEDPMDLSDLPQEKIDARLLHHKWLNDYNKRLDRQYVDIFLANARAAGFEVLLNENLDVVRIQRIPQSLAGGTENSNGAMAGDK